jgi:hypothetical protein
MMPLVPGGPFGTGLARSNFDEIESEAATRAESYRLEHRDELPQRPSVISRTLVKLRSILTRQPRA